MGSAIKRNLGFGSLALLAAFLWGLSSVLIKFALESFSPMYTMTFRFSIASICFLLVFHKRIVENLPNIRWKPCLLIGICLAIMNLTVHYSLNLTTATTATFFFSIPAVFTPFVGFLLFRYRFKFRYFGIVALVVVGLYMLCNTTNGFQFGWGEFLGAVSSLAFAFGMVLQNQYLPQMDNITVAAIQTFIIAAFSWLLVIPTEGLTAFSQVSWSAWAMVAFLGIFGAFVTAILQNISINNLNADFVSVIFAAEPVFTAIIAFFALNEVLTPVAAVGAVLIMVGIVIVTLKGDKLLK